MVLPGVCARVSLHKRAPVPTDVLFGRLTFLLAEALPDRCGDSTSSTARAGVELAVGNGCRKSSEKTAELGQTGYQPDYGISPARYGRRPREPAHLLCLFAGTAEPVVRKPPLCSPGTRSASLRPVGCSVRSPIPPALPGIPDNFGYYRLTLRKSGLTGILHGSSRPELECPATGATPIGNVRVLNPAHKLQEQAAPAEGRKRLPSSAGRAPKILGLHSNTAAVPR